MSIQAGSGYHYVPSTNKLLESEDVFMNDYGEDKSPKKDAGGLLARSMSAKNNKTSATPSLSLPKALFESVQSKLASHLPHKDYIKERENDTSFVEDNSRILRADNDPNNNLVVKSPGHESQVVIDARAGVVNFGNRTSSSSSSSSSSAPAKDGVKAFKRTSETSGSSESLSSSPLSASPSALTQSSYSSISLPPPASKNAQQQSPTGSIYGGSSDAPPAPPAVKRTDSVRMRHNSYVERTPVAKAPHKKGHEAALNDSDAEEKHGLSSSPHCNDVLLLAAAAASASGNGSVNTCKLKDKKTEDDEDKSSSTDEDEEADEVDEQQSILHPASKVSGLHHANSRNASFRRHKLHNDHSASSSRASLTSNGQLERTSSVNTRINIDEEGVDVVTAGSRTQTGGIKGSRIFKIFNKRTQRNSKQRYNSLIIILLCIVNLLNYIDRYTLAGVLTKTQKYFDISDSLSGLLQTVFICSYMLFAPLFGYLGDRYKRKWIIIFGITFWSLMTLLGSFVPEDKFWLFAIIRSLVGIGEASYSCVAPTIIGDLFTNEMRTRMLALFYLATPVGSGLGYIVGSNVAEYMGSWKWALRVTPPLGFICIILLILVVHEPKRGGAEGSMIEQNNSTLMSDVVYLLKNRTFMWITFGFTFASFVLGGLSWWVPTFVEYAKYSNNEVPHQIPLIFGVVTCLSGLLGVTASTIMAPKLRAKFTYADPVICAIGSFIAVPTLFALVFIARTASEYLFWLIAAVAISAMCLSWTIVADILLYAVSPNKRSIASALNILICHLFGDAGSPYVIGMISDAIRKTKPDTYYYRFSSLQTALYAGPFFCALSFAAYLFAAIYVEEDRKKVQMEIKRSQNPAASQNLIAVPNNENVEKGSDEDLPRSGVQQVPSSQQSLVGYANPLIQPSNNSSSSSQQ